MSKITDYLSGQTPLRPEDLKGLIPSHITLKSELNEFEADNISRAVEKYLFGKGGKLDLTYPEDIKKLHREMFKDTWKWAGVYRQHDTQPVGVTWQQIAVKMGEACANLKYWVDNRTFDPVEIAVRFHHRLIWVHPFANGNGRLGRMAADIFIHRLGLPQMSWGKENLVEESVVRENYLQAMRSADRGDFESLIQFTQR